MIFKMILNSVAVFGLAVCLGIVHATEARAQSISIQTTVDTSSLAYDIAKPDAWGGCGTIDIGPELPLGLDVNKLLTCMDSLQMVDRGFFTSRRAWCVCVNLQKIPTPSSDEIAARCLNDFVPK